MLLKIREIYFTTKPELGDLMCNSKECTNGGVLCE